MRILLTLLLATQGLLMAARSTKVVYKIETKVGSSPNTESATFLLILPKNIEKQQKVSITFSKQPNRIFTKEGTRYAEWTLTDFSKPDTITTTIKAILYKHDIGMIKRSRIKLSSEDLKKYTSPEKWIESQDKVIIKELAKIRTNKSTKISAERILKHVSKTLKYTGFNGNDQGAIKSLKIKNGDCNDYTDLFVALCRAKGIPARSISGISTNWKANDTPKHSRAEFFIENLGWIPVDPLWTDMRIATFKKMPSILKLTSKRNDKVLSNFYYWGYNFTGDDPHITNKITLLKNSALKKLPTTAEY